jgi:hypothetical protein
MTVKTSIQFSTPRRLRLRRLTLADLAGLDWIDAHPDVCRFEPLAARERLVQLIASYPSAQFAVEVDHRLVGALMGFPSESGPPMCSQPWEALTAPFGAAELDVDGTVLIGEGAVWRDVLEDDQIDHLLCVGRKAVVQQLGLDETVSVVCASSWAAWRDRVAPQAFVQQVHAGGIGDRAIAAYVRAGWAIRGFWEDAETLKVLVRWENRRR